MMSVQRACAAVTILWIALAIALSVFTQRFAYADTVPVSGSEIVCDIFEQLVSQGQPIPPGLDTSGCESGGGGGGGGDGDGSGGGGGGSGGGGGGSGDGSGGGGGAAPQCEDSVDNDGDGKIDMNDPGCENAADNSEVDPVTSGGGGGGGGGGAREGEMTLLAAAATTTASEPEPVLAQAPTCDWYLTAFIREGKTNDPEQVKRLQSVLKDLEGATLEVNGTYDKPTLAAVHAFQTKYKDDILTPWGETRSTGFVYLTTRKKVNEIYCRDTKFPLSAEEQAEVDRVRTTRVAPARPTRVAPVPAVAPIIQIPAPEAEPTTPTVGSNEMPKEEANAHVAAVGSTVSARPFDRVWRPISDFFSRMFGR